VPDLASRLGTWHLENLHLWSDRTLEIRADPRRLIEPDTTVATIGSCFAAELAGMMKEARLRGAMHPGGLFYSTATIRQELERIAGGWPERAVEPLWRVGDGLVDPFRDYDTVYESEAALWAARDKVDGRAEDLFRRAKVVVITIGLIETWRNGSSGNTYRQIPHPAVFTDIGVAFHRLSVAEMLDDLERIRRVVRETLGAELILTTSPVPLHATFTPFDIRVANTESKARIRAAVSEFLDLHPDVHYFHSYEMVVTAERQSDYYREDGRHVHRHAVRHIVAEFLRLFADPSLHLPDHDLSWLTPIEKTAPSVAPEPRVPARRSLLPSPLSRVVRRVRRSGGAALGRLAAR
jgi:hypothetical protein